MSANLERARELFSRGLAEHLARNWAEAEHLYREALAAAPGRPSLLFNLGRLMLDRERDAEAEALFGEVLRVAGDDHEARYNLGVCLARQGRFGEALASCDRAIALRPDFADAHSGRGRALAGLGRCDEALESHARSMALDPGRADFQANFCRVAADRALDHRQLDAARLERAVLACLAGRNVDYQALARLAWAIVRSKLERLELDLAAPERDFRHLWRLQPRALGEVCNDLLLIAALELITVADRETETLFTSVRSGLLRLVAGDGPQPELVEAVGPLAIALAQQCFLNEYVWDVAPPEQALAGELERKVEAALGNDAPSITALGVIASYRPLAPGSKLGEWCRARFAPGPSGPGRLVTTQVIEPAAEARIAATLKRIGAIQDRTSVAVRAQYEANPYPRWLGLDRQEPAPYIARIRREIAPFAPRLQPSTDSPRILIAGSGTGRHAILHATGYLGASVTAIDLSSASLAYAARKADELGVRNVEFVQGDILDLAALGTTFDVISSIGVLHHMADPARGLRCLIDRLAPGGYLMLGLYSEAARRDIVALRSIIADKGYAATPEGIRACRQLVRNDPDDRFRALLAEAADFYSASMVRDLLFHVMEHRFTIPQIAGLLAANGLRFLGFTFPDAAAKNLYRDAYPADPDMLDLANWAALESRHASDLQGDVPVLDGTGARRAGVSEKKRAPEGARFQP